MASSSTVSKIRLGDVCKKVGSGATPRGGKDVYLSHGVSLIRSQNVYNDHFQKAGLAFILQEHAEELANVEVNAGDVLLNITGDSVARCCIAPEYVLPARVNQHVAIIRPDEDKLDARYLMYFLVSPSMQQHMLALAGAGATRNALTKAMIEDFEVPSPPLPTQGAIAKILGTLDDKIELNLKMNETLEAIAKAIFKSWFVDFDPVRVKIERRQTLGINAETLDLFPDKLVQIEDRIIPYGWRVATLGDMLDIDRQGINPMDFPEEQFYHFSIPAYDDGRSPKVELGAEIKSNKFVIATDSVLISKLNPSTPRIWLPSFDTRLRAVGSTEFLVTRPRDGITRQYLYSLYLSPEFNAEFVSLVTGTSTSHQRVRPADLLAMRFPLPPLSLVKAFTNRIAPILERIQLNIAESLTLGLLRDTLLPRLLMGELNIRMDKIEGLRT